MTAQPLHILVLADRDWTHPQTGGNGANIYGHVSRWAAWGHRVTVVAGHYPGAEPVERYGPNIVVHRMGGRATVFPRAIWAVLRGVGRDADVVLEVINGITFLTPLWLRKPRVAFVHHVHRSLYVGEFGHRRGRLLAWVAETLPLRYLYRRTQFLTISRSAREELVGVGIPQENIKVEYLGVDPSAFGRGTRAPEPRLLYVGRLKAYKRIEHVLDVLAAIPGATLDIAGDGDHRQALEAEIERRGLGSRVQLHGHVDDETRAELYGRAWVGLTASSSEGWSLTVMEAALCGTPSAALAIGGLPESIVDGETGVLAHDMDELISRVRELVDNPELRDRLGDAAERRARGFTWERVAAANLAVLESEATDGPTALGAILGRSNGRGDFQAALAEIEGVAGWLSDGQARRLWDAATLVRPQGRIVEIGSFQGRSTIVLRRAAEEGVELVAVDPHGGGDRGPQEIAPDALRGEEDHRAFHANLERAGIDDGVRHVRLASQDALGDLDGPIDLLYVDGAHRYAPARADLVEWGGRVRPGGTMLVHDAYNAVGVTLAQLRLLFPSGEWRYLGRTRSLAQYRREALSGAGRVRNALRQAMGLPYFLRNGLIKLALLGRLRPVARLLGHPKGDAWPY